MGFAAGFFGTLADNMEERRKYVREMSQRKRDYLMEEGLKRQGEVRKVREGLNEATRILREAGMEEGKVANLLSYDPSTVITTAKLVQERRSSSNPISAGALNQMIDSAETMDKSLADIIKEVTPIFDRTEAMGPVEQERSVFAKILGIDDMDEIDRNVYGQELLGGYTGADIMASLDAPLYRRSEEVGGIDYSAFAKPAYDERDIVAFRSVMVDQYNDLLDNRIDTLMRSAKPEDQAELNRLRELKDRDEFARVSAMIQDPAFGPEIANRFYTEYGEEILPTTFFGEEAVTAVQSFGMPSEETPEGTPDDGAGGGANEGGEQELPKPPAGTTPVTKGGSTVYFDAEGNAVYAETSSGVLPNPEEAQKVAERLGISLEEPKPEPTVRTGSSRILDEGIPLPQSGAGSSSIRLRTR